MSATVTAWGKGAASKLVTWSGRSAPTERMTGSNPSRFKVGSTSGSPKGSVASCVVVG